MDKIGGVPNGWRLVRITDHPEVGEYAISFPDTVEMVNDPMEWDLACIVERIEPQKQQYRPFANASELLPYLERWVRHGASDTWGKIIGYSDRAVKFGSHKSYWDYELAYETWVFQDGTPFGVEVA